MVSALVYVVVVILLMLSFCFQSVSRSQIPFLLAYNRFYSSKQYLGVILLSAKLL